MNSNPSINKPFIPIGAKFAYCSCTVGIKDLQTDENIKKNCTCEQKTQKS
jgi:hypothetical protein